MWVKRTDVTTVGRIRRSRRHPASVSECLMALRLSGLQGCKRASKASISVPVKRTDVTTVGRIRRSRRHPASVF
ncbi:TPA: hypothetical protein ND482_003111 [Citrobacter farmeri]|nr:hypothetical protein [Citrobacter farmeri]